MCKPMTHMYSHPDSFTVSIATANSAFPTQVFTDMHTPASTAAPGLQSAASRYETGEATSLCEASLVLYMGQIPAVSASHDPASDQGAGSFLEFPQLQPCCQFANTSTTNFTKSPGGLEPPPRPIEFYALHRLPASECRARWGLVCRVVTNRSSAGWQIGQMTIVSRAKYGHPLP